MGPPYGTPMGSLLYLWAYQRGLALPNTPLLKIEIKQGGTNKLKRA